MVVASEITCCARKFRYYVPSALPQQLEDQAMQCTCCLAGRQLHSIRNTPQQLSSPLGANSVMHMLAYKALGQIKACWQWQCTAAHALHRGLCDDGSVPDRLPTGVG